MPKATLTTKSGTTVLLEGSSESEVSRLLSVIHRDLEGQNGPAEVKTKPSAKGHVGSKPTPMTLLSDLIGDGFFATPKELGAVRVSLEQRGHYYPVTSLSPLMLRLVRRKELRRIKDKNRWTYVN